MWRIRTLALIVVSAAALVPLRADAQFWTRAPADYEDCAEAADKIAAKTERAAQLSQCEARFAGRRKPGGGYTYFDLLQDRHFDIAGPNPTADELKVIDQHYTRYLAERRRTMIAEAFAAKQQQDAMAKLEPAVERPPLPRPRPTPGNSARPKQGCGADRLSCGFQQLADGISNVKKSLFGAPVKGRGG